MKFLYDVLNDNNEIVFTGSSNEVKDKYLVTSLSTYTDKGNRLLGQYRVVKKPMPFYPKENQEYYYYSLRAHCPIRAFWDSREGMCLVNQTAGNIYQTREQCQRYGKLLMEKLQDDYLKEREAYVIANR